MAGEAKLSSAVSTEIDSKIRNVVAIGGVTRENLSDVLEDVMKASKVTTITVGANTTITTTNAKDFNGKRIELLNAAALTLSTGLPNDFGFECFATDQDASVVKPDSSTVIIAYQENQLYTFVNLGADAFRSFLPPEITGGGTQRLDLDTNLVLDSSYHNKLYSNYSGTSKTVTISAGIPHKFDWYGIAGKSGSQIIINAEPGVTNTSNISFPLIISWDEQNNRSGIVYIASTGTANEFDIVSDVIRFNQAPTASPTITGAQTAKVGVLLTGEDNYADAENDAPGVHTYEWLRADNTSGLNETVIASTKDYTPVVADEGKFLRRSVVPVATSGASPGAKAYSAYTVAVASASQTFTLSQTVQVDFARYSSVSPADWNKALKSTPSVGSLATDMLNTSAVATTFDLSITQDFSGGNEEASFDTDGPVFPASVLRNTFRVNAGVTGKIKISGLDNTKYYTLRIIGRAHTSLEGFDNTTVTQLGAASESYQASNNTGTEAQFAHIAPTATELEFSVSTTGTYGFLSGMIIEEYTLS